MKMFIALMALLVTVSCSKVPAGYVGVKVYLLGTDKGVDTEELGVGRYFLTPNEELYIFPTFQQNKTWQEDNSSTFVFQTSEGLTIGADIGISYHLQPDKISSIFQKYRKGIDEITDIYIRNHIRNALNQEASTMKVTDIYGVKKSEFFNNVFTKIRDEIKPFGIIVDKVYLIGSFDLPDTVINALNSKIEATQKAQQRENEIQQTIAEANKVREEAKGRADAILTEAKAKARANRLITQSISSTLIEYNKIEKWSGDLPNSNFWNTSHQYGPWQMKKEIIKSIKFTGWIALFSFMFGLVVPTLISSSATFWVALGFILLIFSVVFIWSWIKENLKDFFDGNGWR